MEITRTRSLTISMGDYESFKTEASVTATLDDIGVFDVDSSGLDSEELAAALQGFVADQLDAAMADDIADAQSLTGNRKSFIHRIPTEKD